MPAPRRAPAPKARAARPAPGEPSVKALPLRTPISELGLSPAEARTLTPAARKLNRGHLLALLEGEVPRVVESLTIRDLNSIRQVFAASARGTLVGRPQPGCCCCCCDPCCCCCCVTVGRAAAR